MNLFRYFVALIVTSGFGIMVAMVMGLYLLGAITISGFIIVKVVEFFGWKRVRKLKF